MPDRGLSPGAVIGQVRGALSRNTPLPVRRAVHTALVRRRYVGLTPEDLLFVSFPKSGSTWLRFVLAEALTGESMDFDRIQQASPPLGRHAGARAILPRGGRMVKSHELPAFASRRRPKIVYLLRDGRDVAVSYRTHLQRRGFKVDELDTFVTRFAAGEIGTFGSWQDHVAAWTAAMARSASPSTLVRYEDLRTDPTGTLLAAGEALAVPLDRDRVEAAFAANTPEAMRAKEEGSAYLSTSIKAPLSFVGAARSGGWREQVSPAVVAEFDRAAGTQLLAHGYPLGAGDPGTGT